eukprot:760145-Pelagomonas_calceolata.AAC.2
MPSKTVPAVLRTHQRGRLACLQQLPSVWNVPASMRRTLFPVWNVPACLHPMPSKTVPAVLRRHQRGRRACLQQLPS